MPLVSSAAGPPRRVHLTMHAPDRNWPEHFSTLLACAGGARPRELPNPSVAGNAIPTCQHQHGDEQDSRSDPPVLRHGLAICQSGPVGIRCEILR